MYASCRTSCRALVACVYIVACVVRVSTVTVVASTPSASHTTQHDRQRQNSTLVNELRRQLMENNYDYMPSESEEPLVSPRPSLFNKKAAEDAPPATPTTPTTPVARYTYIDKTHLEFDLEFNNPNREYDIHNNINTKDEDELDRRLNDHDKEYNDLDRDYTDLKQKHGEIVQRYNRDRVDRPEPDLATLQKEHDKLNAKHERDPPNREYDGGFDKSNQMLPLEDTQDDIDHSYDMHNNKYENVHKLNDKMKEKLKKHHNEDGNNLERNEYMKRNIPNVIRGVNIERGLGMAKVDDIMWTDVNSSGITYKHIEMEKEMGFLPRAQDDTDAGDESTVMSKKHGVHKNDLLYYMNDERLKRANDNYLDLSNAGEGSSSGSSSSSSSDDYNDKTTTTVKYNVFTVISEGGGRRAGSSARRRTFVREQRPGEVVLVRLDDEPFPQFRLPAPRRQYMHSPHNKH